ncbi:hypothetical protein [Streptomyces sp. NPDC086989]|uniref:hypothetical protein n=1 Tax=Streptomyces sp. NPDC086989 TaxID=3365764 RepID=UPI00380DD78E
MREQLLVRLFLLLWFLLVLRGLFVLLWRRGLRLQLTRGSRRRERRAPGGANFRRAPSRSRWWIRMFRILEEKVPAFGAGVA